MDEVEQFDLYRRALFAIMLSFTNGQGDVVSACLDFSLPVIVSTHPALIEAAQGLMPMIDPNDRDGWLARILQLTENKTDLADIQRSIVRIHRPTV
ncbi:hypothetical protein [Anderseniella sp. Alg231-50]|uniref:hypothetical protein n=1 Tax=Anderseniella sp. Alg231-50 TaxID=1922226 RepID=UPI000D54EA34